MPQTHETLKKGRKKPNPGQSSSKPIKADEERMMSMAVMVALYPDTQDFEIAEVLGLPVATIETWREDDFYKAQLKTIAMQSRLKPILTQLKWGKLEGSIPDVLAQAFEEDSPIPYALKLRAIEIVGDRGPSGHYAKRTRTEVTHRNEVTGVDMTDLHRKALEGGHGPQRYIEVIPDVPELAGVDE